MLLNSRYNNFVFAFPKGFIPADVEKRYDIFLRNFPTPYENLTDFLNSTVQSVLEIVEQNPHGKHQLFRTGADFQRQMNTELTVTFRTTEGFINYYILQDILEQYWLKYIKDSAVFVPDLYTYLLDDYGYLIMTMQYTNVVYSGLSELELSYASNVPEFRTFTATFNCAKVSIKRLLQ